MSVVLGCLGVCILIICYLGRTVYNLKERLREKPKQLKSCLYRSFKKVGTFETIKQLLSGKLDFELVLESHCHFYDIVTAQVRV